MNERALDTLPRAEKGRMAPPPTLDGALAIVANAISSWPGVTATAHWDLCDDTLMDGIDFYVGDEELGHIHLDGSLHLPTTPTLGKILIAERLARAFPYGRGWVCEDVGSIGALAAIDLFNRNYDRISK